jgi:hypothetical protein
MDKIKTFLLHLFTGVDNHTFDIARVLWALSCMAFIGLAIWHVVINKQPFSGVDFGGGAAGVLGGGGLGVAVKSKTEPSADAPTT